MGHERGAGGAREFCGCNGGRARAGSPGGQASRRPGWRAATGNARAPWSCVMAVGRDVLIAPHRPVSVRYGGAVMTSRRVRGPAAHRAADRAAACKTLSVCYLPCHAPRLWRGGAMGALRPTATGHECGARRRGGWKRTRVARTATGHGRRCGWLCLYGNIKNLY